MDKFSENYYLRKCYLKRDEVPTQSVMRVRMGAALAGVYFAAMSPASRALGGLEPGLRGGGADWLLPPRDALAGRLVLKPVAADALRRLTAAGLWDVGARLKEDYHREVCEEIARALRESDRYWKSFIERKCINAWNDETRAGAKRTTAAVRRAFDEFRALYKTSLNRVEDALLAAAGPEVRALADAAHAHMAARARALLRRQAEMLTARYDRKLQHHKERHKGLFLASVARAQAAAGARLHELSADKHAAAERLRHLLRCERRAAQLYVALQERAAAARDGALARRRHEDRLRALDETLRLKDAEIEAAERKQRVIAEFNHIWSKKVCRVVKKFQLFTSYCLRSLPEHAAFFIDMERLMMLQMDEALASPSAASLFVPDPVQEPAPAQGRPFVVCGDVGRAPPSECPVPVDDAHLPALLVNERCLYARCDTFDRFADKVRAFAAGARGAAADLTDDRDPLALPVRPPRAADLRDLELQSSLMRILRGEDPPPRAGAEPAACRSCGQPACFCRPAVPAAAEAAAQHAEEPAPAPPGRALAGRRAELVHERQPKWESYAEYVRAACCCPKAAQKHLMQHLPAYMRAESPFTPLELGGYEACSAAALRAAVQAARAAPARSAPTAAPPRPALPAAPARRDVGVQFSDVHFEYLCSCFDVDSIEDIEKFVLEDRGQPPSMQPSCSRSSPEEFATRTAVSLAHLISESPELKQIFERKKC